MKFLADVNNRHFDLPSSKNFADAVKHYREVFAPRMLRDSTFSVANTHLKVHLEPDWNNALVDHINIDAVNEWAWKKRREGLAWVTIKNVLADPGAFYNREDLWTVATEVGMSEGGQQVTQRMQPNFVLMKLPGETGVEFVEILPFTPANRNNLIGWIAGRSDGEHYGTSVVYNFPKTKLVDGPLQIEARIDQNAQLSGQLTLWNQQGSHVRRGALLVIPCGRGLLYAEPIYLQAERSPMPELRLVVLAVQDRLVYGPTFESAMAALFGGAVSSMSAAPASAGQARHAPAPAGSPPPAADLNALIAEAAKDLADYQRLTAEGKLGEAGQKLEELKRALDKLNTRQR
jgi:uncharacterized protein